LAHIKRIIITTGDTDGIGLEVSLKALRKRPLHEHYEFLVFVPSIIHPSLQRLFASTQRKHSARYTKTLDQALALSPRAGLTIIQSPLSPARWVELSAKICTKNPAIALVTAPLSKDLIRSSGYRAVGHTEILKSASNSRYVFMAFLGKHFHVLLATGHIPLKNVSSSLTKKCLTQAILASIRLRKMLPARQGRKPLALVGLNPHAGEHQIIGAEEAKQYVSAMPRKYRNIICGPLVPDVAYQKPYWKKYSLYIAPYHDQGLIPFKLIHGHDSGAHVSVGLPFIRTSVDHGTAKDIFGKNLANASSMEQAINWACQFLKEGYYGI
jgi:4-hydroxythreonine-4-phosphate dehydrogenase